MSRGLRIERVTVDALGSVWAGIVADDLNPQRDGEWYACYDDGGVVGASHLVRIGDEDLFDDLWVRPDRRRTGVGAELVRTMQSLREDLWLIADPDGVAYYERFGFQADPALPAPIAARYETLGLWPGHLDHLHIAMRWTRRS